MIFITALIKARSSVGRALPRHGRSQQFKPARAYQNIKGFQVLLKTFFDFGLHFYKYYPQGDMLKMDLSASLDVHKYLK